MTFRHIRRSRNVYTGLGLGLSFLGVVAVGISFFHTEPAIPRALSAAGLGLFFFAGLWCARAVLYPFDWELVVDGDLIRWGRADHPDKQQRVAVSRLERLIYEKSGYEILGDTGSWQQLHIGEGVLVSSAEQRALVDYLRREFPQLKVELR